MSERMEGSDEIKIVACLSQENLLFNENIMQILMAC